MALDWDEAVMQGRRAVWGKLDGGGESVEVMATGTMAQVVTEVKQGGVGARENVGRERRGGAAVDGAAGGGGGA
ncbi:hypothetical protein NL676_034206 [Syzygium grande]|nr:hypothetical protein NL676_034206 [Syzygium grande]